MDFNELGGSDAAQAVAAGIWPRQRPRPPRSPATVSAVVSSNSKESDL